MEKGDKAKDYGLNITEAVQMLSSIADFEQDGIDPNWFEHPELMDEHINEASLLSWLKHRSKGEKERRVREMFRVILDYLQDFYKKHSGRLNSQDSGRIHSIMVLVGEATRKLEKYTDLFRGFSRESKVADVQEVKDLQHFYFYQVEKGHSPKNVDKIFKTWKKAYGLRSSNERLEEGRSIEEWNPTLKGIEVVKADTDYELFYLKKEDRSLFFHSDILKAIQRYCHEAHLLDSYSEDDLLLQVKSWHDKSLQLSAKGVLHSLSSAIKEFFASSKAHSAREAVCHLRKTVMALMLCSNPRNLLRTFAKKSSYQYFKDFLFYLRETLACTDYRQILQSKTKKSEDPFFFCFLQLCHGLCYTLFTHTIFGDEIKEVLKKVSQSKDIAEKDSENFEQLETQAQKIARAYLSLEKVLKNHPHGPLFKVLDIFLENNQEPFDPIMQDNIPHALFELSWGDESILHLRLPSPTKQEYIHKALVNDEFKGLFRYLQRSKSDQRVLFVNFQGRTDWKEYARSLALERCQFQGEFSSHLFTMTLPKNTDFYHQFAPYHNLDHAKLFLAQFEEHIFSESAGFSFPKQMEKELTSGFVKKLLKAIHQDFFLGKDKLARSERLNFIEICYLFLQLKAYEVFSPTMVALSCKDGLDVAPAFAAQIWALSMFLQEKKWGEQDLLNIQTLLHSSSLFVRERAMLPERFYRFLQLFNQLEKNFAKGIKKGNWQKLFKQKEEGVSGKFLL